MRCFGDGWGKRKSGKQAHKQASRCKKTQGKEWGSRLSGCLPEPSPAPEKNSRRYISYSDSLPWRSTEHTNHVLSNQSGKLERRGRDAEREGRRKGKKERERVRGYILRSNTSRILTCYQRGATTSLRQRDVTDDGRIKGPSSFTAWLSDWWITILTLYICVCLWRVCVSRFLYTWMVVGMMHTNTLASYT